jgi:hypothetical protein
MKLNKIERYIKDFNDLDTLFINDSLLLIKQYYHFSKNSHLEQDLGIMKKSHKLQQS